MNLTVVLVTQPNRIDFFLESLQRLEKALSVYPEISLLVIFNGASDAGVDRLGPLEQRFPERVKCVTLVENEVLPDKIMRTIRDQELGWIHLPGDDDLVIPETYSFFFDSLSKRPELSAMAFYAQVIDLNGSPTGKVLRPIDFERLNQSEILAFSLHKPPFVWPSLIFDVSKLSSQIFSSRFVFDWWVGLQLVCQGLVETIKHPLIEYRVHQGQESFQTFDARKRFEAEIMIQSFLMNSTFWISFEKSHSKESFVETIAKFPPIYGDRKFGTQILISVLNRISLSYAFKEKLSGISFGEISVDEGVLIPIEEFPLTFRSNLSKSIGFPFLLDFDKNVCVPIVSALNNYLDSTGPNIGRLLCEHSVIPQNSDSNTITIKCRGFEGKDLRQIRESVTAQLEVSIHKKGRASSQLALWELRIVDFFRLILRISRRVRNFLHI